TKRRARSNRVLSTRNFSHSGAGSRGGVLHLATEQKQRRIRINRAWNSLCAQEIRKTLVASGPAGTARTRNRAQPRKRHQRGSCNGKLPFTTAALETVSIG